MNESHLLSSDDIGIERSFGIVFAVVFSLVGIYLLCYGVELVWQSLIVAAASLILGVMNSPLLRPLNYVWCVFGKLLGRIISSIVIGVIFAVAIVPTSLLVRIFGKDLLRLKLDPASQTYWIKRVVVESANTILKRSGTYCLMEDSVIKKPSH